MQAISGCRCIRALPLMLPPPPPGRCSLDKPRLRIMHPSTAHPSESRNVKEKGFASPNGPRQWNVRVLSSFSVLPSANRASTCQGTP